MGRDSFYNKRTIFRLLVYLFIPLLCGTISVLLGKDSNWDLLNYHYYNPYSFLTHRLQYDINAAQIQTFLNPAIDLPFYWMSRHFSSWIIGFILGFAHGLSLIAILVLFFKIVQIQNRNSKIGIGLGLLLISGLAPGFFSELGTTMNDNLLSFFIVIALILCLVANDKDNSRERLIAITLVTLAGLVAGFAAGLKLTIGVYALGLACSIPILFSSVKMKIQATLFFCFAVVIGVVISSGFWHFKLWTEFHNPVIPVANTLFKSPYAGVSSLPETRFFPKQIWEYLVWPLVFSFNSLRVCELKFYDFRFALVYLLFIILFYKIIFRYKTPSYYFRKKQGNFLLVFFITTFIFWMFIFSFYRYLIALELIVPLIVLILLDRLVILNTTGIIRGIYLGLVVCVILFMIKPLSWGRVKWSDPYISVSNTSIIDDPNSLVIMLGYTPMSFVIPHFNPKIRFVRLGQMVKVSEKNLYYRMIQKLIRNNEKNNFPIYILFSESDFTREKGIKKLAQINVKCDSLVCYSIGTNTWMNDLKLCKVIYSGH
jgi:hypothetical protein